jgi:ribonuclease HII
VAGLPRGARPPRRRRWTSLERDLRRDGGEIIAGVDEVGRGSLAGPVVACAIIMPPDARALRGVDDSKVLPPAERRRLHRLIMRRALAMGLGAASVDEIDRLNIYHATTLAMRRALARLPMNPDHVLIDGRPIRTLGVPHIAVVDGDDKCFSIACASIVAKVTRDRLMAALAARHPAYAWESNVGYGTPAHLAGLRECGACDHHRRRFVERVLAESGELPPSVEEELRESDALRELDEGLDGDDPASSESALSLLPHESQQHM